LVVHLPRSCGECGPEGTVERVTTEGFLIGRFRGEYDSEVVGRMNAEGVFSIYAVFGGSFLVVHLLGSRGECDPELELTADGRGCGGRAQLLVEGSEGVWELPSWSVLRRVTAEGRACGGRAQLLAEGRELSSLSVLHPPFNKVREGKETCTYLQSSSSGTIVKTFTRKANHCDQPRIFVHRQGVDSGRDRDRARRDFIIPHTTTVRVPHGLDSFATCFRRPTHVYSYVPEDPVRS